MSDLNRFKQAFSLERGMLDPPSFAAPAQRTPTRSADPRMMTHKPVQQNKFTQG